MKNKKKCVNHAPTNHQEKSIEEPPSSEAADSKLTTSLKINPQRDISHGGF